MKNLIFRGQDVVRQIASIESVFFELAQFLSAGSGLSSSSNPSKLERSAASQISLRAVRRC